MYKIAVLMTCFNRVETTLRGLRSLFAAKPEDCEFDVWLVDDASPDNTGLIVKNTFPNINVVKSSGNLFWCRGMRLAWDSAMMSPNATSYDYFLWFNDDDILKPNAISGIIADSKVCGGIISGKFSSDTSESDVSYGFDNKGQWMNGNLVLIPRKVFEKIGPIYDGYRHAYSDHDYGLLAKRNGFVVRLSSNYCGVCPRQPERYLSMNGLSLRNRFKVLLDTKGICLHDAVLFRYRNWGIGMAIVCYLHLITRALCGLSF